tara:strand:- start:441 stop:683 length:243 start_codon:yes stop_codon:yes gene_type:complete
MANITINIPNAHVARVLAAVKGLFPIPLDENGDPTHTNAEWGKKIIEDYLRSIVKRYEQRDAMDVAKAAVSVPDEVVGDE